MAKPYIPYVGPIVKQSDARVTGLKYYFTGRECKNGHLSQRVTVDGRCPECCRLSYKIDPEKRRATLVRYREAHLETERARSRKYCKEHPEQRKAAIARSPVRQAKIKATATARRHLIMTTDPEGLKEGNRRSYALNREARIASVQRYQAANVDKLTEYRASTKEAAALRNKKWQSANPDKVAAKTKRYQTTNPENGKAWKAANPAAVKAIKQNRRALERCAEGRHTAAEINDMLTRQNGQCVYCNIDISAAFDVDHIRPLSRGGSNWISNIQLLCGSCNNRKWAIDPIEFIRRLKLKAA